MGRDPMIVTSNEMAKFNWEGRRRNFVFKKNDSNFSHRFHPCLLKIIDTSLDPISKIIIILRFKKREREREKLEYIKSV